MYSSARVVIMEHDDELDGDRFDLTDEEEDETMPGPSKRAKTGAGTYQTKFKVEWKKSWPFIQEVKNDPYKFLCTLCNRQVSCGHMGKTDVERHIGKAMHKSNAKSMKSQSTLNFQPVSSTISEKVY
jgi:hypothetical protein